MTYNPPKRVLIVDDSRTIRSVRHGCIDVDTSLVCVGEASDPYEAIASIKALSIKDRPAAYNLPKIASIAARKSLGSNGLLRK